MTSSDVSTIGIASPSEDDVQGLRSMLRGPVLTPRDEGYEESRRVWNAMIDNRPALVARCLGVADVIASVQFARERNLLLCIKGGGHNIAGLATADGALMLDMSLMRGVWVDRERKVAHAQAGCLLGDVDRETQVHGLATVLGFVSLTGIAGLTLGGGFGYLTRRWGLTTDNVVGMDIVTADGRLVRASSDENEDLFWGLRGVRGGRERATPPQLSRPGNPGVFSHRNEFRLRPRVCPAVAFGQACTYHDRLQGMQSRGVRRGPSHDLADKLRGRPSAQVGHKHCHSCDLPVTSAGWLALATGQSYAGKAGYGGSRFLKRPPAPWTAAGLFVSQLVTEPLLVSVKRE